MMGSLFFPLVIGLLVSIALGYPAILLAKRFNLIDIPGSATHKTHINPTPLAGGILLATTLAVAAFIFREQLNQEVSVVFVAALVVFFFGIWDD